MLNYSICRNGVPHYFIFVIITIRIFSLSDTYSQFPSAFGFLASNILRSAGLEMIPDILFIYFKSHDTDHIILLCAAVFGNKGLTLYAKYALIAWKREFYLVKCNVSLLRPLFSLFVSHPHNPVVFSKFRNKHIFVCIIKNPFLFVFNDILNKSGTSGTNY